MALIYDTWAAAQEDRGLIPPPEDPFDGSEVCSLCGEPSEDLTIFFDGAQVCADCLEDYIDTVWGLTSESDNAGNLKEA